MYNLCNLINAKHKTLAMEQNGIIEDAGEFFRNWKEGVPVNIKLDVTVWLGLASLVILLGIVYIGARKL